MITRDGIMLRKRATRVGVILLASGVLMSSVYLMWRREPTGPEMRRPATPAAQAPVLSAARKPLPKLVLARKASPTENAVARHLRAGDDRRELVVWLKGWRQRVVQGAPADAGATAEVEAILRKDAASWADCISLGRAIGFVERTQSTARLFYRAAIGRIAALLVDPKTDQAARELMVEALSDLRYPLWQAADWPGILAETSLERQFGPADTYAAFDASLFHAEALLMCDRPLDAAGVAIELSRRFDQGEFGDRVPGVKRREMDLIAGLGLQPTQPLRAIEHFRAAAAHAEDPFAAGAAQNVVRTAALAGLSQLQINAYMEDYTARFKPDAQSVLGLRQAIAAMQKKGN